MKNLLNKFKKDVFLKNNVVFFVGSMIVAVLNYLYYPVLGRLLSVENFGEAQTINTLVLQSTVILSALGYVTIHLFSNINDKKIASEKVKNLEGSAFVISALALILILFFQSRIIAYFKFSSFVPLFSICIIFLINIPFTIKRAWIQAKEDFFSVSVAGAVAAFSKLLFAAVLILLGYKISGVISGLIIATFLSLIYVTSKADTDIHFKHHLATNYLKKVAKDPELRKDLYYIGMILAVLIAVTIFYSADILFVRRYFSVTVSGLYAGVSAIANIIFFATLAFSNVMLPTIRIGELKVNQTNFYKALAITIFTGMGIWLIFFLFPKIIIGILIGEKYLEYSALLPQISLFILLASVSNVILIYLIALKKRVAPVISILGVLLLFTLISLNNESVNAIVKNFIYANTFVLAAGLSYVIFDMRKKSSLSS